VNAARRGTGESPTCDGWINHFEKLPRSLSRQVAHAGTAMVVARDRTIDGKRDAICLRLRLSRLGASRCVYISVGFGINRPSAMPSHGSLAQVDAATVIPTCVCRLAKITRTWTSHSSNGDRRSREPVTKPATWSCV